MLPRPGELEEARGVDRARLRYLRLRRAAASHRDDDRGEPVLLRDPSDLTRDRRLSGAFAGSDHRDGRHGERRLRDRGIEPEVRAAVHHPARERDGGEVHPLPVADDGLVGEIHDRAGRETVDLLRECRHRVVAGAYTALVGGKDFFRIPQRQTGAKGEAGERALQEAATGQVVRELVTHGERLRGA